MSAIFRKHKFIWLSLLALLAIACGVGAYQHYQKSFVFYAPELVINDYEMIGDNDAVVIDWRLKKDGEIVSNKKTKLGELGGDTSDSFHFLLVRGRYASSMAMRLKEDPVIYKFHRNKAKFGEYWKIVVYDLENKGAAPKEYDVFEMVREYDNRYAPGMALYKFSGYTYNGKEYREIVVRKINDANDRKVLLMDLSTGELIEKPEEINSQWSGYLSGVSTLRDYFDDLFVPFQEDGSLVLTRSGIVESESWQLGEKDKKALSMMREDNARLYRTKWDPSKKNIPEVFDFWQLLLPKGRDIFSDLTLYSEYSKDNADHPIHSVEEFEKYYDNKDKKLDLIYGLQ